MEATKNQQESKGDIYISGYDDTSQSAAQSSAANILPVNSNQKESVVEKRLSDVQERWETMTPPDGADLYNENDDINGKIVDATQVYELPQSSARKQVPGSKSQKKQRNQGSLSQRSSKTGDQFEVEQ